MFKVFQIEIKYHTVFGSSVKNSRLILHPGPKSRSLHADANGSGTKSDSLTNVRMPYNFFCDDRESGPRDGERPR